MKKENFSIFDKVILLSYILSGSLRHVFNWTGIIDVCIFFLILVFYSIKILRWRKDPTFKEQTTRLGIRLETTSYIALVMLFSLWILQIFTLF